MGESRGKNLEAGSEVLDSASDFGEKSKTEWSFSSHVYLVLKSRVMTEDLPGLGVASMFKPDQTCYLKAVEQACPKFSNSRFCFSVITLQV